MTSFEPGQQWSEFRLLERIADSGHSQAEVWLAKLADESQQNAAQNAASSGGIARYAGITVVLKILAPMPPNVLATRLTDWRATQIPNVMPLLGVHTQSDRMALALPYVPRDSADLRGARYEDWSQWLEQVLVAVAEMHEEDFIHGDLKLTNIRRDEDGAPLIADPWLPGDGKSRFTSSPERLAGGKISKEDDAFATGALMHELMTGYPPGYPEGSDSSSIVPRSPAPVGLVELALALMSTNPERRPTLEEAVERYAKIRHAEAPRTPARAPAPKISPPKSIAVNRTSPTAPPVRDAAPVRPPPARSAPTPSRPSTAAAKPAAQSVSQRVVQRAAGVDRAIASQHVYVSEPAHSTGIVAAPFVAPHAERLREPQFLHHAAPAAPAKNVSHAEPLDVPIYASSSLATHSPFAPPKHRWIWPVLLILAAIAVAAFVWLPPQYTDRMRAGIQQSLDRARGMPHPVASPEGAAAPAPSKAAANPPAPADLRELANEKLLAEQWRDRAGELDRSLREQGATARPLPEFIAAAQARETGLSLFDKREFNAAQDEFKRAVTGFEGVRAFLPRVHAQTLAAGQAALSQCLPDAAVAEFRYALALSPQDETARAGIQSAQVCERVIRHVSAGQRLEQAGDREGALGEYQQAQKLDPNSVIARDAANAITNHFADDRFASQIAVALDDLRAKRFEAAASAIAVAEKIRPGSDEVRRLRAQLNEFGSLDRINGLKAEALDAERAERWDVALQTYQAVLAIDPTLVFARQGAQHAQNRLSLQTELQSYLDHPRRLGTDEVRAAAAAAVERAQLGGAHGRHIQSQIDHLSALLVQFDAPIDVNIFSDALTNVTLYRVGELGRFGNKRIALKPGIYTLVGSRQGYRDVRMELAVSPGQRDASVEIRCMERI